MCIASGRACCAGADWKRGKFYEPKLRNHRHGYCGSDQHDAEDDTDCRREDGTHGPLSEGLLLVHCPHGVCLGFELLDKPETPAQAFGVLYERCIIGKFVVLHVHTDCCSTKAGVVRHGLQVARLLSAS
jgi:hypothetical protein